MLSLPIHIFVVTNLARLVLLNLVHQATETRPAVSLEDLHAEDLRNFTIGREHILVEHSLATLVKDVAILVNQVASRIDETALSVHQVAICIFI